MKNLILITFTLSFTFGMAQKDAIYKEIAKKTCACLEDKNLIAENLESNLGLCMMNVISENSKLTKDLGLSSTKSIEKLGENVGVQMAFICPEVFMLMIEEENAGKKNVNTNLEPDSNAGIIEGFENKGLKYLLVKDNDGRINKYLWLRSFEGDAELLKMGNKVIGSKVIIESKNIEIFNPELGEYIIRKEITSIKF